MQPTKHFTVGRDGMIPDTIVLHISTGSFVSCINWFADPTSKVSSHYLISLKGQVVQFVDEKDTAWANGQVVNPTSSLVKARTGINPNKYTISIEHEGKDLSQAPQAQIDASAKLVKEIATRWNIPIDREHIIGHSEVKLTKPNCPSPNKNILDLFVSMIKNNTVPKTDTSKKEKAQKLVDELQKVINSM